MAIEVRIRRSCARTPTVRRPSRGKGDTLAGLLDDLDGRHPGLRGRLVTEDGGCTASSTSTSTTRTSASSAGWRRPSTTVTA